ncbi:MAG: hypothetical protein ACTHXT_11065 [Sphingobacterium sp.]
MANWCNNVVQFSGDEQKIKEIDALFNQMALMEKETRHAQLPSFVQSDDGYCFDIRAEEGTIYYDTKWVPNTAVLVQIADHFQTGFVHEYSEIAMGVFGEATYENGTLIDHCLDYEDFARFDYGDDGLYTFEGESYESDMEILELLLDRKKEGLDSSRGYGR